MHAQRLQGLAHARDGFTLTTVRRDRGITDASGKGVRQVVPPRAGSYQVVATAHDGRGNTIRSTTYLWVSGPGFADMKKISDANPQQKEFLWSSGSKLIEYTSAKGDKLQGALFLPANYQPGKSYPTIVYIYEKLSQGLNSYTTPTTNGFNKSVYTSNGYAVLMPDIVYKVNDPGMSAVWCVLPALEAAIKTGVVDKDHVGIQGHSWGGYQTAFLITQTDAFRAAIAGAPLTEMISMYYSIYWNSGGGNMAIFESSQGRFTGSPIDVTDAYVRNSPISHAKNVKTPLVYTNVLVRNWQAWINLKVHDISAPMSFHHRVALDFPVSLGGYQHPRDHGGGLSSVSGSSPRSP